MVGKNVQCQVKEISDLAACHVFPAMHVYVLASTHKLCMRHLCSQVRILAEAIQKTTDVRPRQQALHQSWTGCDLL